MTWKNKIVKYVLEGDLNRAIDCISTHFNQAEKPIKVLLGVLCYRYHNTINLERKGVISPSEGELVKEKIVRKLLEIALEESDREIYTY